MIIPWYDICKYKFVYIYIFIFEYTYIYLEPKRPLFWLEKALFFGGLTFTDRGHWGSRCIYIYIYIQISPPVCLLFLFLIWIHVQKWFEKLTLPKMPVTTVGTNHKNHILFKQTTGKKDTQKKYPAIFVLHQIRLIFFPPHILWAGKNTEFFHAPPLSSWWFQPIWKILVKLDHFPT